MMNQKDIVITVPTAVPSTSRRTREIDLSTMNSEDLKALRKDDPFLYYSIPKVVRAFRNRPVDPSSLVTNTQADAAGGQSLVSSCIVSRQTRISDSSDLVTVMSKMNQA